MEIFSNETVKLEYNGAYKRYKVIDVLSGSWISLNKFALKTLLLLVKYGSPIEQVTLLQRLSTLEIIKLKNAIRIEFVGAKSRNKLTFSASTIQQIETDYDEISLNIENSNNEENPDLKRKRADDQNSEHVSKIHSPDLDRSISSNIDMLHPDCFDAKYAGTQYYSTSEGIKKFPE